MGLYVKNADGTFRPATPGEVLAGLDPTPFEAALFAGMADAAEKVAGTIKAAVARQVERVRADTRPA